MSQERIVCAISRQEPVLRRVEIAARTEHLSLFGHMSQKLRTGRSTTTRDCKTKKIDLRLQRLRGPHQRHGVITVIRLSARLRKVRTPQVIVRSLRD